jgi:Zn-dependent protease
MRKPAVFTPGMPARTIASLWGTPVVVIGRSWLPVTQLALWPVMNWRAGKLNPERSLGEKLLIGTATTCTTLGVEWCHNLAHVAAARIVDRPMDALRIVFGMPLCVYYDLDPEDVSPRQHILRALGGPAFNLIAAAGFWIWREASPPGSPGEDIANTTLGAALLILGAGLLPYPGLDGGPILKWSLVELGKSRQAADRFTQRVDGVVGAGLTLSAVGAARRGRRWLAALLGLLGLLGLAFAVGLVREE